MYDRTKQQNANEEPDIERPASASATEEQIERELPTARKLDFSPSPPGHDPYAAWRFRDYRLFSLGWFVSVIGAQIGATAIQWEVYDRTKSELFLSWVAGLQVIPVFLLMIPAGNVADRHDRRRVILLSNTMAALCSIAMAMISYRSGSVPWMLALLTLSSACLVLGRPARSSILPLLVSRNAFPNGVTWNASMFQISAIVGPGLGGVIVALSLAHFHSLATAYIVDAVCLLSFASLILFVHVRKVDEPARTDRSVLAGVKFIWRNKLLLGTISLDMFAVLLGGAAYLLALFAKDIIPVESAGFDWLKHPERMFGWLKAAEAVGALVMTLTLAHLPPMKRAGRNMLLAVVGFGLCVIVFGLSRSFWLSFAALIMLGVCDSISVVVRHTLVQVLTPDEMRGRVSAVNNLSIGASNELGGFESGMATRLFASTFLWMGLTHTAHEAKVWGATASVVFGGIAAIIVVALIAIIFPKLRRFGSLHDARAE